MIHKLKILEPFADAVASGAKSFEVRKNDRGYNAGDLVQFEPVRDDLLSTAIRDHPVGGKTFEITYVLSGWGIESGYVAFGIAMKEESDV